jgi:large subunit ribosomal protein L10
LTAAEITRLADVEPREVLLAKLASAAQAPLAKLAGLVQALPRNAASVLAQLRDKKEAA